MAALLWAQTRMRCFCTRLGSVRPSAFCRLSWTARLDLADMQQVGCTDCRQACVWCQVGCHMAGRASPLADEGHGMRCRGGHCLNGRSQCAERAGEESSSNCAGNWRGADLL